MKFKTLFQRRPAASMAESDETPSSTTKRKKKETKALTPSIKSPAGVKNAFIKTATQEKCASRTTAEIHVNTSQRSQPQPDDESVDCIRYSYENCGQRENPKVPLIGNVITMKLTDDESTQKCNNMELNTEKTELEEHKVMLLRAQDKIKELTDEMEKMKCLSEEKDKEFVKLHEDFLLCIRGSERFRYEAEVKAEELQVEVNKLKEELYELKSKKYEGSGRVTNGSPALTLSPISEQSSIAASVLEQEPKVEEAMEEKKLVQPGRDTLNPQKVEDALNESMNKRRDEKLSILRKNCRGSLRNGLLNWCKTRTQGYPNVEITNFSTSWTNGLALAALIHSLNPEEFDYNALKPSCPIDNFKTALKAAEKYGVSGYLNAINLIVESENPPWEPIVAYVTEVYLSAPN